MRSPITINVAISLGYNPQALLLAVMFGVSTAFVTPFAHQVNLVVMEAGNYRFSDYIRVGVPLTFIVFMTMMAALPIFWPL